jgi:hypothetical protein
MSTDKDTENNVVCLKCQYPDKLIKHSESCTTSQPKTNHETMTNIWLSYIQDMSKRLEAAKKQEDSRPLPPGTPGTKKHY